MWKEASAVGARRSAASAPVVAVAKMRLLDALQSAEEQPVLDELLHRPPLSFSYRLAAALRMRMSRTRLPIAVSSDLSE